MSEFDRDLQDIIKMAETFGFSPADLGLEQKSKSVSQPNLVEANNTNPVDNQVGKKLKRVDLGAKNVEYRGDRARRA